MLVKVNLIFLEVVEREYGKEYDKKKILFAVFYDQNSQELVKPFLDEAQAKQLKSISFGKDVICELDLYQGKRGMGSRLIKCVTDVTKKEQTVKSAVG